MKKKEVSTKSPPHSSPWGAGGSLVSFIFPVVVVTSSTSRFPSRGQGCRRRRRFSFLSLLRGLERREKVTSEAGQRLLNSVRLLSKVSTDVSVCVCVFFSLSLFFLFFLLRNFPTSMNFATEISVQGGWFTPRHTRLKESSKRDAVD